MYAKYDKKKRKLFVTLIIVFFYLFFIIFITCLRNYKKVCAAEKTAIVLSSSRKNMIVGEYYTLEANIPKEIANNRKIQWKSSKSSVASVNQKGTVKAKKKGTAKITITIKGTTHKATCIVNVSNIFSERKFAADLNGDGKSENLKVTDIRNDKNAYVVLTAYVDGKTISKKYSGYYSSNCIIGDLSGNGADDVILLNYNTSSMHGETDIHVLYFSDGEWMEYPDKFIQNPSISENQPDCFSACSIDIRKNSWVGATILHQYDRNYLRCILLDTEDPKFDTVMYIDASFHQDGWYVEDIQIIENYYSAKKRKGDPVLLGTGSGLI